MSATDYRASFLKRCRSTGSCAFLLADGVIAGSALGLAALGVLAQVAVDGGAGDAELFGILLDGAVAVQGCHEDHRGLGGAAGVLRHPGRDWFHLRTKNLSRVDVLHGQAPQ